MNLQEELGILKQRLEAEQSARRRAELMLETKTAELERLSSLPDLGKTEKKLQDQRAFFEEILNRTPADIFVMDTKYHYLFVNPSAVNDPAIREWMIGKTNEEFNQRMNRPPGFAKIRRDILDSVLKSRQPLEWEEEVLGEEGVPKY